MRCPELGMDLVGSNIRKIRKEQGLSQKELAAKAKWDPSNLSKLESGAYNWNKENLSSLALALAVDVSAFFRMEFHSGSPNYAALQALHRAQQALAELGQALIVAPGNQNGT